MEKQRTTIDSVHAAIATFECVDQRPDLMEAAWTEVARESGQYVIGYYEVADCKAWEMIYTDLLHHGHTVEVAERVSAGWGEPIVAMGREYNIGISSSGYHCHRLRLWQESESGRTPDGRWNRL